MIGSPLSRLSLTTSSVSWVTRLPWDGEAEMRAGDEARDEVNRREKEERRILGILLMLGEGELFLLLRLHMLQVLGVVRKLEDSRSLSLVRLLGRLEGRARAEVRWQGSEKAVLIV